MSLFFSISRIFFGYIYFSNPILSFFIPDYFLYGTFLIITAIPIIILSIIGIIFAFKNPKYMILHIVLLIILVLLNIILEFDYLKILLIVWAGLIIFLYIRAKKIGALV